jgi:hypothetical protein
MDSRLDGNQKKRIWRQTARAKRIDESKPGTSGGTAHHGIISNFLDATALFLGPRPRTMITENASNRKS